MAQQYSRVSLKIVSIYALIGLLWILLSDKAVWLFTTDPAMITTISMIKGMMYVLITAILLYWLIERHVSEVRLVENELKTSKETFLKAFTYSPMLMSISTIDDGRYIEVNNMFTKVTGFSCQEAIGRTAIELGWISTFNREQLITTLRRDGRVSEMELELTTKDGRSIYCLYSGEIITIDGQQRLLSIAMDITDRKRIIEQLKVSEENYRSFAGLTSDYVHKCTRIGNAPFRVQWIGGAVGSISGYTTEEIYEKGCWLPLVHPDDREAVSAQLFSMLPGDLKKIEFRLITKQGETRWISEKTRCVAGEQEGELILFGASTDITEKRGTEEKLRESEELFRLFMRYTPIYTFIKQIEGDKSRVLQLSDNFVDMVGRPAEELRGRTMEEMFPPDFARKITDDDIAVVKEGKNVQLDEDLNGRHYKTIKFPILREGKDNLIAGFTIDDTDRKLAEQALTQYANIVQNMQVGLYVYHLENPEDDRSLRLVAANPRSASLLGLSGDDIIGKSIDDIFPNLRQAGIPEKFADVARTGHPLEVEEFIYSDQNVKETAFAFKVFQLPDNHVGVLFEDITLRKEAETALQNINKELEQRVNQRTAELNELNKELKGFNYSISHDMRAPLIRIKGYADILLDTCAAKLSEEELYYISRLKASCRRLDEHIEALLKLYQIDRSSLYLEPVNLSNLTVKLLTALQELDPDRKVAFGIADEIVVNADKVLMQECLYSLIRNAWTYTSGKEDARIELGITKQDARDVYFIRDNGVGFNMDQVDNIFTPFLRLHADDTGLGIGLAAVQRIIRLHGGKIWAESKEGEGATFYFTLKA